MADDTVSYDSMTGSYLGTDTITINGTGYTTGSITVPSTTTVTLPVGSGGYGALGSATGYTITGGGSGGAGTSYNWINNSVTSQANVKITSAGIDLDNNCDIKKGNISLFETLKNIEDRLAILHPNPQLEAKWEQLKELRRQYEELERDIIEKEKIMDILREK